MPLAYSAVARETTVLAEYTPYRAKDFAANVLDFLQNCDFSENTTFGIEVKDTLYTCIINDGFAFLSISVAPASKSKADAFLRLIKGEFTATYAVRGRTAAKGSLNKGFMPTLRKHMEECEQGQDKTARIKEQVDEVKGLMVRNIEKVLGNHEQLSVIQDKSEFMAKETQAFTNKARTLRTRMWWGKLKMQLLVCSICIVLVVVLFCSICFSGGNCLSRDSGNDNNNDNNDNQNNNNRKLLALIHDVAAQPVKMYLAGPH